MNERGRTRAWNSEAPPFAWEDWEPIYSEICEYFGFDRQDDERSAEILSALLSRDDLSALQQLCAGRHVTVCGNAPCLKGQIHLITGTVFAADAASEVLFSRGILPHAVFTDLDGATGTYPVMNERGTVMVVHAHGDNIPLIERWVPRFRGPVVGTCQSMPLGNVHNFGGFTDGDRAVFAAKSLGADTITILGFDLDDTSVDPMKRGKLRWARILLRRLGYDL